MKKFLKWLGITVLSLAVVTAITIFILVNRLNGRMEKTYSIAVEKMNIPSDSLSFERGKSWVSECQACHGEALEGKKFFDDPQLGTLYSPNLTRGEGGIGKTYRDEDWIRAIRHGVKPNGKALFVMPAEYFQNLSQKDLSSIISYLKTVPPVDNVKGENNLPWLTKVIMQLGGFGNIFPAEVVQHNNGFNADPVEAPDRLYGKYVVSILGCATCHGENMGGGKSPDPNAPYSPNLTSGGNLAKWTVKDFIETMHTGETPEKKKLDDKYMAWKHYGQQPELRLTAIYEYLKSLPKVENPK